MNCSSRDGLMDVSFFPDEVRHIHSFSGVEHEVRVAIRMLSPSLLFADSVFDHGYDSFCHTQPTCATFLDDPIGGVSNETLNQFASSFKSCFDQEICICQWSEKRRIRLISMGRFCPGLVRETTWTQSPPISCVIAAMSAEVVTT